MYKLTKAEGASKASDDSDSVFGISAELEQNWREGIPLALQLPRKNNVTMNTLNAAEEHVLKLDMRKI